MGHEVKIQGEMLNKIEEDVMVAKENAVKAESEILSAKKGDGRNMRKLIWIIILIFLVVVAIVLTVVFVALK
jgi:syntaxin 1B/2/3